MTNTRWRGMGLAALTACAAGCYQYRAVPVDALREGQTVHVSLTAPGTATLASSIGPRAIALDGRIVKRVDTSLTIAVTRIGRAEGTDEFLRGEPVALSLGAVSSSQVRSADRPRTLLVIGGIVAAVVAGQIFIDQTGVISQRGTVPVGTK